MIDLFVVCTVDEEQITKVIDLREGRQTETTDERETIDPHMSNKRKRNGT